MLLILNSVEYLKMLLYLIVLMSIKLQFKLIFFFSRDYFTNIMTVYIYCSLCNVLSSMLK